MKIVSYHSNLYLPEFKHHVSEIKEKGFDTILFCITETDMLYNLVIFEEFRQHAESRGLKTWATFWGLTAGEAICKECDVYKWLGKVIDIGFENVMIDEPKIGDSIHYIFFEKYKNINFHLCAADDTFGQMSDEEIKEMPVKSIGVSCYHWVKDWTKIYDRTEAISKRLYDLRPDDNFVFLQGFDLPEGYEHMPIICKDICTSNGIVNFGFWSFRATITGTKRSANPELIWSKIKF